jgi:hypothetical protein
MQYWSGKGDIAFKIGNYIEFTFRNLNYCIK